MDCNNVTHFFGNNKSSSKRQMVAFARVSCWRVMFSYTTCSLSLYDSFKNQTRGGRGLCTVPKWHSLWCQPEGSRMTTPEQKCKEFMSWVSLRDESVKLNPVWPWTLMNEWRNKRCALTHPCAKTISDLLCISLCFNPSTILHFQQSVVFYLKGVTLRILHRWVILVVRNE
jgi:hypothetical protein